MAGNTGKKGGQYDNKNAEKWTEEIALELGNDLIQWLKKEPSYYIDKSKRIRIRDANLFLGEFLVEKRLDDATLTMLCKIDSFAVLYARAKKIQELKLAKHGCLGFLEASMTKFCLINHHGYKDKIEQTNENINYNTDISLSEFSTESLETMAKMSADELINLSKNISKPKAKHKAKRKAKPKVPKKQTKKKIKPKTKSKAKSKTKKPPVINQIPL